MSAQQKVPAAPAAFHDGERRIQQRLGVADKLKTIGQRVIRDHMPDQHRALFEKLPYLIAGTLDDTGQPWASVLFGTPGFVSSPDARTLAVTTGPAAGDPLHRTLRPACPIGLLGIELSTRRRNRANGLIDEVTATGFKVHVQQSFGNCPKYIQARAPITHPAPAAPAAPTVHRATVPDGAMQGIITRADTFFIASTHPGAGESGNAPHGVDVSHRGGNPGFVAQEEGGRVLTIPDYQGNFFFNTLGNLLLSPGAGLLFMDFDTGDLLYLAAKAEIIWDGPEVARFKQAQRLLRLHVTEAIRVEKAMPWTWTAPERSPHLAET